MPSPPPPSNLAENPWFWLALFGGMGMLGIVVIGPKHAARTARIERMHDTRQRVAIERANSAARTSGADGSAEREPDREGESMSAPPEPEPYVEADFRPPTSLKYLLALMTIAMLVGTAGVLLTRSRERRAAFAATAQAVETNAATVTESPKADL
ncbi:MAG: hypothetical protein K8U03_27175 [Planctomycetia bacterium]|nr:hypothetical protein [Planctomycetia bacterium]